jgi:hypothetical protein
MAPKHLWRPSRGFLFWALERSAYRNEGWARYEYLRYPNGIIRYFWTRKQAQARADELNQGLG